MSSIAKAEEIHKSLDLTRVSQFWFGCAGRKISKADARETCRVEPTQPAEGIALIDCMVAGHSSSVSLTGRHPSTKHFILCKTTPVLCLAIPFNEIGSKRPFF